MTNWEYDAWPSITPDWGSAAKGDDAFDNVEFHVDLGCGTVKKGRIGIDRYAAPGVDIVMDLDDPKIRLPFDDSSIRSVISHHCLEHIGEGFIPLMDELYRVLVRGGLLRVIVPLFPSYSAVSDADHCRYFMEGTFDAFCGHLGSEDNPTGSWLDSFSVPYTKARFHLEQEIYTPRSPDPTVHWTRADAREMRTALVAVK